MDICMNIDFVSSQKYDSHKIFYTKPVQYRISRFIKTLRRHTFDCIKSIHTRLHSYAATVLPLSQTAGRQKSVTPQQAVINQTASRLLGDYGNHILRLAYSYVHNMSDAEDILQETLIRFLKTAPSFENASHEKAWLFTVAANLSKNRLKSAKLHETDELKEELAAENREDLSFVWEAVRSLPTKYREVIHLYYYEGCSTADIARILNRKESTIRSDLRRGRQQLKEILKEAYDFA